jgi:hypothetical protein
LGQAVALFGAAPFRWWLCGGIALELHAGRAWRRHADTDVGIIRHDAGAIHGWLDGWVMAVAARRELTPWRGEPLEQRLGQNNVWLKRASDAPWTLDLTVGEGDLDHWIYRRDPRIRRSWDEAVLQTPQGVPYLAPELQLLFKSKNTRPIDHQDADQVLPLLTEAERTFLESHLPAGHPWRAPLE